MIGRSGAGKSTLLCMINRLADPSHDSLSYGDLETGELKGSELTAWRGRCAIIFQQFGLVGRLDVLTNWVSER